MNVGDRVTVYGTDEHNRIVDGMSGTITDLSVFWAHVALTCWGGEVVRVERIRLVPLDPVPKTAEQWRRDREDWAARNRRQVARLRVRVAA
mgnify:CR=1 FL=1